MNGDSEPQTKGVCYAQHDAMGERLGNIEKDTEKIFEKLDRLPNWAVALIALLTALVGWLVKG